MLRRSPMNKTGKSTRSKQNRQWTQDLREWWIASGLPQRCEICGGTFGLALAHSKKRRFILTKEDFFECAALCQTCHTDVEYGSHERMETTIKELIERRSK